MNKGKLIKKAYMEWNEIKLQKLKRLNNKIDRLNETDKKIFFKIKLNARKSARLTTFKSFKKDKITKKIGPIGKFKEAEFKKTVKKYAFLTITEFKICIFKYNRI